MGVGCAFFDLDVEIERHFGTSIERLQARFLTDYSYRTECTVVLKRITMENPNCVITLPVRGRSVAPSPSFFAGDLVSAVLATLVLML